MNSTYEKKVRVACAQFYTGTDVHANLQTVLRMIDEASAVSPDVLVLPEFCNHTSWYKDRDYSYDVAIELDAEDPFLEAVSKKVAQYGFYVMLNCTVKRPNHQVTGTNILFDPTGRIVATSDKQVLMGNENNFLSKAQTVAPIVETPFGKMSLYSCMDGVIFETPRGLALRGAQILLNSLNSFALDEASLHVPTRASENKVFVVAANKVGLLVPDELAPIVAERVGLRVEQLHGAGESQIVAPDGTVLAQAPLRGEAVIFADIDPTHANDKRRPDGTDLFATRTPDKYAPLAQKPTERKYQHGADIAQVGVLQDTNIWRETLRHNSDLALLALVPHAESELEPSEIEQFLAEHNLDTVVVWGNLVDKMGFVITKDSTYGVYALAESDLVTFDMPFGRLAVLIGTDTLQPEVFRLCALQNVEVVVALTKVQEQWELATAFRERAAENRLSVVVASPHGVFGGGAIFTISADFTLWTKWQRPFDGNINYPLVQLMLDNEIFMRGEVFPSHSGNRLVSQQTDVVDGRPYWLLDALLAPVISAND
jgi:deaminated glutathione amidase